MPRDPAGTYSYPPGIEGVPDQTIESADYNSFLLDVQQDLNLPRPIVAGGSGASTPDGALDNLSAEKFQQVVTNWDSNPWRAGSFYAATTASGTAPVASHAFAGIAYYANATDFVLEATDLTDPLNPTKYIRIMVAGVWGNWLLTSGGSGATGDYTFDGTTTFPPVSGQIRFNNATENSTTELFISHLNALGVDNTGTLTASLKSGYDIFIQDKDEPAKYKVFTANAAAVVTGGDFRITVGLKNAGIDIVSGQRVSVSVSTGSAVVYDVAQNLTTDQQAQARSNIGQTKKNYIINGAMMVSQENGSTAGLSNTGDAYFPVDMFNYATGGTPTGIMSMAQVASATPGGSPNRIRYTVTTAQASVAPTNVVAITYAFEGLRTVDLKMGTASAKTVTLQFGCKGPAGTYCIGLRNPPAYTRCYVAEFTIAAGEANTDVVKSVTVILDTTGAWASDNTISLLITWCLMIGSGGQGAANVWAGSNYIATANQFNFMGTGGNVFELFDVSLTEGNVAPPFMVPDYGNELAACKRYFQKVTAAARANSPVGGGVFYSGLSIPEMRAAPTTALMTAGSSSNSTFNLDPLAPDTLLPGLQITASGDGFSYGNVYKVSARL